MTYENGLGLIILSYMDSIGFFVRLSPAPLVAHKVESRRDVLLVSFPSLTITNSDWLVKIQ